MRVVVTGSTGFIGWHLVKKFIQMKCDISLIIRPCSNRVRLQPFLKDVRLYEYDGSMSSLNSTFQAIKPDLVIHLASLYIAEHKMEEVTPLIESNILFATQLLEAMNDHQCRKIVSVGTFWQNYNNESDNPTCLYAATKQAFESILKFYSKRFSLQALVLKLYDTFGPNDARPKLFSILRRASLEDKEIEMTLGEQQLNLLYIDDVVDAFMLAAYTVVTCDDPLFLKYSIRHHDVYTLREVVSVYETVTQRRVSVKWGAKSYRPREMMKVCGRDPILPGFYPKISLDEGIRKLEASYD